MSVLLLLYYSDMVRGVWNGTNYYERVADCTRTKQSKGFLHPSVSRLSVLHANQPQICNICPHSTFYFGRCTPLFISIARL